MYLNFMNIKNKATLLSSYILLILLFANCSSVEKYNENLGKPIAINKLIKDVDYVQHKLEKLHPSLYMYISKNELNGKFDSLRKSITKPLTSKQFFFVMSPIVASVRQGHMTLSPPFKRIGKQEQKRLAKLGTGPLSQFDFEWIYDKLYVVKNKSKDKGINLGAEVVSINKITPQEIHNKYRKTYTSDGFNTTYFSRGFSKRFSTYMTSEIGINDSLHYVFKQNDSLKNSVISRFKTEKKVNKVAVTTIKVDAKKNKLEKKIKRIYGYDELSKTYSKNLNFIVQDSSVAVLKIKDFSKGKYYKAYAEIFEKLKQKKTKTLIIDLRNNPGGRVEEVVELYSYLTDKEYTMLQPAIVTSKTSLWKLGLFSKIPTIAYPFAAAFYPFYMGFSTLRTKKDKNGIYTYSLVGTKKRSSKSNHFSGKIYVIINGGSFSAACLLSSSLKSNKEVTFVGEETGGGFNTTVAGLLPVVTLPNSKLPLRIGLMDIKTTNQTNVIGHGIYPDYEIKPSIQDKIEGLDTELDWIINAIKKE
ncbi:S41 family peptidase [Flavobacterium sp.]|uniref:S41 family peptidase n=1 Tax=Flavobacterium sp. TaxID=239 RepID=UPI0037533B1D